MSAISLLLLRSHSRQWLAGAATALALTGCAGLTPDAGAAATAALQFAAFVGAGDGAHACALLAAATVEALEHDADDQCPSALLDEDLPAPGTVEQTQAFGTAAEVVLDADVMFLTVERGAWKVTAAGCVARPERPYLCTVSGG